MLTDRGDMHMHYLIINSRFGSTHTSKVDPAETRAPDQSNFRTKYEPGSNKNYMGRKVSAR